MDRIDRIAKHRLYQEAMRAINSVEKDRIYCKHGFCHQMDVARIGYILYLEEPTPTEGSGVKIKELIYAAALLHDIGRAFEYRDGIAHEIAAAEQASFILPDCGFNEEEVRWITGAIAEHRKKTTGESVAGSSPAALLKTILMRADNLSRPCFSCEAEQSCKWSTERKNSRIMY